MLEVILALAAAILLGNMLAHRIRVTPAILLIFLGLVLALLPAMHDVREVGLPPHVILEIFLPIMLFWEARGTSLREVRKSFRAIVTSGTTLVVATALAIAWALNSIFGIDWGTALIIGAALAPTDATAVATLNGKLPKRSITVLKAESLINDGTTLVMFALALHLAGGADVSLPLAGGMLGFSFLCGIIVGLAVGWAANRLRAYITNPMNYTIFMMAVPFSAFLLSETIEISDGMKGSGVVAVVVAAFYMTYNGIDTITPQNRFYGLPIWAYVSYLMNGALFVLVGVQLPEIWRSMEDSATKHNYPLIGGLSIVLVAWSVSMLVRFLMMRPNMISDVKMDVKSGADGADAGARGNAVVRYFVTRWKVRRILREPELRGAIFRDRVVSTMAGLRGGVSLAVALSVDTAVESRDFIILWSPLWCCSLWWCKDCSYQLLLDGRVSPPTTLRNEKHWVPCAHCMLRHTKPLTRLPPTRVCARKRCSTSVPTWTLNAMLLLKAAASETTTPTSPVKNYSCKPSWDR